MPGPRLRDLIDKDAARELELYMSNDEGIYRQHTLPIQANLRKRIARGVFDADRSVTLWMYQVEAAAKKYTRQFDSPGARWSDVFSPATRRFVAKRIARDFMAEEGVLPR